MREHDARQLLHVASSLHVVTIKFNIFLFCPIFVIDLNGSKKNYFMGLTSERRHI